MRADIRFAAERSAAAFEDFLRRFPGYAETAAVDDLRAADYARLDRLGHTYLDYTGGGLYAESQIRRHEELLAGAVLGNPHSQSPTSLASAALAREARDAVRRFFNAPEDEFEVVFTPNASGALKLVGEAYPFGPGGVYLLSYDNHNSVNGIREFAARKGAAVSYIPVREQDLRLDPEQVRTALRGAGDGAPKLFAYPAQSNFSGAQHPLEWVAEARELGWDVILDCAAFAPTNPVDALAIGADFVPVSFYKLFGYPTGSGCLIARREALAQAAPALVRRRDHHARLGPGRGLVPPRPRRHRLRGRHHRLPRAAGGDHRHRAPGVDRDGRRSTPACGRSPAGCSRSWRRCVTATARRSSRCSGRGTWTAGAPPSRCTWWRRTGSRTTSTTWRRPPRGERISVRSGCFCNPGDGEIAHRITRADVESCFSDPSVAITLHECQQRIEDATGKVPNTIRVSLGVASDFGDVYRFMAFVEGYRDRTSA